MPTKNGLKLLHSLQQKKFRQQHRLFMVEGTKSVMELLQSDFETTGVYATEAWQSQHPGSDIPGLQTISEKECAYLSSWKTPPGVMACVRFQTEEAAERLLQNDRLLVLDGIQDCGNMGTIIRTADWFGIRQLICSPQTVEWQNPKCIQSSMGSFTRVMIHYRPLPAFLRQAEKSHRIYGTFMDGEPLAQVSFPARSLFVIGSEAHGISAEVADCVNQRVTIPRKADHPVDSLNAAIATAILCYEMTR